MTANINALKTLKYKYYQTPLANQIYERTINKLKEHIKQIDNEIKNLIDKDNTFKNKVSLAKSVPGVGLLLAANLLVLTKDLPNMLTTNTLRLILAFVPMNKPVELRCTNRQDQKSVVQLNLGNFFILLHYL
ncbi:MAG: hypothetical protein MZV64_12340 [Ignavibacteriales bacterium]|nr:hypothetical protein [Ignavibacteriales bacterium]